MRRVLVSMLLIFAAIFVSPVLGLNVLDTLFGKESSGWVQAGVALVSFPIVLVELDQIRRTITRKPRLEVGLINVQDLPFSRVRDTTLMLTTTASTGYAHFYLVVRNNGEVPAKNLKIVLEHTNRETSISPLPFVKVSEFEENKPTFYHEHNFEFVFRAGSDWMIYPKDIEAFGFHVTTKVYMSDEENAQPVYPPACEIELACRIWADGLDKLEKKSMVVRLA